jgi:hypothetical protein
MTDAEHGPVCVGTGLEDRAWGLEIRDQDIDGMNLYSLASLDENLIPMDRLKLSRIDPAPVSR